MGVRRALVCSLAISLLLPAGVLAAVRKRHRPVWICRPGHAHVVAANTRAEVFEVGLHAPRFDGCVYGKTHRYGLGEGTRIGGEGSDHYTLAGTTVAFVEHCRGSVMGSCATGTDIRVVDLRNDKTLKRAEIGDYKCGGGQVLSLVLNENGGVAVMQMSFGTVQTSQGFTCASVQSLAVWVLLQDGEREVGYGGGIDPNSLALVGSTVYWTQEGQPHSAPLH